MPHVKSPGSLSFGVFLVAAGAAGLALNAAAPIGSAMRMGPGYFPIALSWICAGLGTVLVVQGFAFAGPPLGKFLVRPFVSICASVAAFMALETIGLVAATVAVVLVSGAASAQTRWAQSLVLSVGLAAFAVLVFVRGLGLAMPVWPAVLGG